jgi:ADP-heptose:LPS heptosyltransferase
MSKFEKRKKKLKKSWERLPEKVRALSARFGNLFEAQSGSHIAFEITGGMGDHILAARFIRDLTNEFPGIAYDIYCSRPALARWIFESFNDCRLIMDRKANISAFRSKYLFTIQVVTFACVTYRNRGQEAKVPKKLTAIINNISANCDVILPFIQNHPKLDGYLGHYSTMKGARHNFLHQMAGIPYGGDVFALRRDDTVLAKHGLEHGAYITISNGYDEDAQRTDNSLITKVYPYFADAVRQLKASHPDLKIIQIGSSTSDPIPGTDLNLINKTTLQEASALLKHAVLHVDNEGGLVHLASALGTRSAVVFGPTLAGYFGYERNINIAPQTCGGCWWMEATWMSQCVKGHEHPPCMYTQQASHVAKQISAGLARNTTLSTGKLLKATG